MAREIARSAECSFAIGNERPNPARAVEQVVNASVEQALREAEALLVARLGAVSRAELAWSFDARCVAATEEATAPAQKRVRGRAERNT